MIGWSKYLNRQQVDMIRLFVVEQARTLNSKKLSLIETRESFLQRYLMPARIPSRIRR